MGKNSHDTTLQTSIPYAFKWIVNETQINNITKDLTNSTIKTALGFLFASPSESLVSLKAYPFDIRQWFNLSQSITASPIIYLNKESVNDAGGIKIKNQIMRRKLISTIPVSRKFNNFLDYAPYTKLELYLPFIGFVTLDNTLVLGESVNVFYAVDFDTGGVTAYLETSKGVVMQCSGIIGFDIPLGSTNNIDNARTMIANGASIVGGLVASVATENPLPVVMATISATASVMQMSERVTKGGAVSNKGALNSPYSVYLIRTYVEPIGDGQDEYKSYKGLPLMEKRTLGDLDGFTRVKSIHLENLENATESEKGQIERLLQMGVII